MGQNRKVRGRVALSAGLRREWEKGDTQRQHATGIKKKTKHWEEMKMSAAMKGAWFSTE